MENINIKTISFKKSFLFALIISLSVSALVAIYIFLSGNFEDAEIRILLTTLAIGGYSLMGLCSSALYEKKKYIIFTNFGIIVSIVGFLITVCSIWELWDYLNLMPSYTDSIWQLVISLIILSISVSHASLLLIGTQEKKILKIILYATLLFITVVASMLINTVYNDVYLNDFYYRLLGVFAVLDVLGTIILPILRKITKNN